MDSDLTPSLGLRRGLLPFLGVTCGVSVASMYYNQPLLLEISKTFGSSAAATGEVAVATQVGYAAGLMFLVPLGDVLERRRLILRMFGFLALAMLGGAFAPTLSWLILASVVIGVAASVTHIVLPIAPEIASDEQRGAAIGTVMTGLLLGILLARTAAGWLSHLVGWRGVFVTAAVASVVFAVLVAKMMPHLEPHAPVEYGAALRSLWTLTRTLPALRESAVLGALVFAAFSAFWTTLAFLLGSPQYKLGAGVAGNFGVLGAAGALIAPVAGKAADRRGTRHVVTIALGLMALGYVALWLGGRHMAGLVVGVIVLDLGLQCNQIANQTRIFGLMPQARSRLNTVYMTVYFVGASLGSAASTWAWSRWGWNGVVGLGLLCIGLGALRHITGELNSEKETSEEAITASNSEKVLWEAP